MNIFRLNNDPWKCATMHSDIHVNSQLKETAQMIITAIRVKAGVMGTLNDTKRDRPYNYCLPFEKTDTDGYFEKKTYLVSHQNHPCSLWIREGYPNFLWTVELLNALNQEFLIRNRKWSEDDIAAHLKGTYHGSLFKFQGFADNHGSYNAVVDCVVNLGTVHHTSSLFKSGVHTPPPTVMPEEYIISDNILENYRNYYKVGKAHLHKFNCPLRPKPEWL